MTIDSRPIGVFDSGVGGLTVVNALLDRYPSCQIIYVADQAHVPYGERPLTEIHDFASGISDFLLRQGCRAIVMACNISSATARADTARRLAPIPVIGTIEAGARSAIETTNSGRIGVLATTGTVKSGAFSSAISYSLTSAVVSEVACPKLVPIVEAGEASEPSALAAAHEYLAPLALARVDAIILGCTHYPFLLESLNKAAAALFDIPPKFIDPAGAIVEDLSSQISLDADREASEPLLITSGNADTFKHQAKQFVQGLNLNICGAQWRSGALQLLL